MQFLFNWPLPEPLNSITESERYTGGYNPRRYFSGTGLAVGARFIPARKGVNADYFVKFFLFEICDLRFI
jgi:hypothetical protein